MKEVIVIGLCGTMIVAFAALHEQSMRSPPHWEDVCVEGNIETYLMPILVGKSIVMTPQSRYVCTEYERVCVTGEKYEGELKDCVDNH